ncbi:MAG: hypothetical protein QXD70_02325 [Candidatus Bathyarchaeia archaeon]
MNAYSFSVNLNEYIFNLNPDSVHKNFTKQRNKIARKLRPKTQTNSPAHASPLESHNRIPPNKKHQTRQANAQTQKIENTDLYTQLLNLENDEWHVATAKNLEEETKLIEAGFEYVRYSEKDEVAIYRKRK